MRLFDAILDANQRFNGPRNFFSKKLEKDVI